MILRSGYSVKFKGTAVLIRALVSTGATGAVAPELFEEHIGQKQIFCDISKILLVKK